MHDLADAILRLPKGTRAMSSLALVQRAPQTVPVWVPLSFGLRHPLTSPPPAGYTITSVTNRGVAKWV